MSQQEGQRIHRVLSSQMLRAAVVVTWMIWLAWLLSGERYKAFIVPDYWPLVAGSLLVVALFAVALLVQCRTEKQATTSGLSSRFKAAALVLLLPLLFAPLAASARLGGFAFDKRFVGGPNAGVTNQDPLVSTPPQKPIPIPVQAPVAQDVQRKIAPVATQLEPTSMRLPARQVTLSQLYDKPEKYINRRVSFEGIVHRDADVTKGQAWVYRYLVMCCAADAQPLAIRVDAKAPELGLDAIEEGVWVRVEGVFRMNKTPLGEVESVVAESVKVIEPPEQPYLYYVASND